MGHKSRELENETYDSDFIEIKCIHSWKETLNKMEGVASDWLKIFVKHIFDKEPNPEHMQKITNAIMFKTIY